MTREEAIVLIERSVNELKEMMQTITMPQSAAEQLQKQIEAHQMAISALRQQETVTNRNGLKNEPLTLDELRKMDGEPVWVVWPDGRIKSKWWIVNSGWWMDVFWDDHGNISNDYGTVWLAYRQKPKEG